MNNMNMYDAVMNVEDQQCDEQTFIASMQHLINTGVVWSLHERFGRLAVEMVDAGVCHAPEWHEGSIQ